MKKYLPISIIIGILFIFTVRALTTITDNEGILTGNLTADWGFMKLNSSNIQNPIWIRLDGTSPYTTGLINFGQGINVSNNSEFWSNITHYGSQLLSLGTVTGTGLTSGGLA